MKKIHIYLVSDASGESIAAIGEAAHKQFSNLETIEYMWPMIRSQSQVDELIAAVRKNMGIVLHTMVYNDVRQYLIEQCEKFAITQICPMESIVNTISKITGISPGRIAPGKHNKLDNDYFMKLDKVDFTMSHDDGNNIESVGNADIIILGVSRTSKTPVSLYLAHRGYKVANIPIIKECPFPFHIIKRNHSPMLIGLAISTERLIQIRNNRISSIGLTHDKQLNYSMLNDVKNEIEYGKHIFNQLNANIINVSHKAVEEIAGEIIKLYHIKHNDHRMRRE